MKRLFSLSAILCGIIVSALIFGSLKNDEGFYHSPFFLLLLIGAAGITFTCLILRRKVSIDSWLIHSGFLVILAGSLVSFLFGYRQVIEIKEGEKQGLPKTGLAIRLDDFELKFYEDKQSPKEFKSTISIFDNNQLVKKGEVLVNHPFTFKGFNLYQQSYSQAEVSLRITSKMGEFIFKEIGDEAIDSRSGLTLKLIDFLPDFVLGSDGKPFSRSEEFNNPAVKIAVCKNEKTKESGWLFLKHKDFHHQRGKILDRMRFEEIVPTQYRSSLEVVKDPGARIVLLGTIIFLVGLIRRFYLGK